MPTWTQTLAIGVPAIDEQHRDLFERAEALLAAMKRRTVPELWQLLRFLGEHCSRHFQAEEALMREQRHPRLREHGAQHAAFLERFGTIEDQFTAHGPSVGVTIELQEFFAALVHHVRSEDAQLGRRPPAGGERAVRRDPEQPDVAPGGAPSRRAFGPVFVQRRGKPALRLDFTGRSCAELLGALEVAGRLITAQPRASLRILTVLDSALDAETARAFKRYALSNAPHVLASGVVASSFWKVMVTDLQVRGRDDLRLFDDETSALDWLASC